MLATELLGDLRRLDGQIKAVRTHSSEAVLVSGTTFTEVHGVGHPDR